MIGYHDPYRLFMGWLYSAPLTPACPYLPGRPDESVPGFSRVETADDLPVRRIEEGQANPTRIDECR